MALCSSSSVSWPKVTPICRKKRSMSSRYKKSARCPLCTCSIRPRQRDPAPDHSRQKRTTKVVVAVVSAEGRFIAVSVSRLIQATVAQKRGEVFAIARVASYLGKLATPGNYGSGIPGTPTSIFSTPGWARVMMA